MSISTADAASTPLFYNIHSRPTRLLSAVSMTLKQASRLTLNNKNDVVCWDAACNKKIAIWKGCLGKNGFGKVPSPVLKLFLGTFTATLAPPRIQMSKHSKLFGWYGTMQRNKRKRIHPSFNGIL